ncbi:MAG TPA: aminotransferase class III-fold pyridoxal phosphate-dependent enzyme [Bacillota bacterium]|nr:aminotransferase class III-fold pyridoxal phosphate-dependent enzyme [Bacillota bacterium]
MPRNVHKLVHKVTGGIKMHLFTRHINPYLGRLLERLNLDREFVRGEGCYLYDRQGRRYLDCIAAYGALPFGHNPPAIWEVINRFQEAGEPAFIQPSALRAAGELAQKLIQLAPGEMSCVTFANSGAETVEAAVKLCRSATGRMGILSTENSFHGKTLAALSATGNCYYQSPFGAPVEGFHQIPFGSLEALEEALESRPGYYAAFIVEPIQGEGGIVEPPRGYLAGAREICARHGVLLVVDEVQTGLGRTGRLFACTEEGVAPDLILLAKALGGGLMPIGACLCTGAVYNESFGLKHSSTFAGNSLACRVGLKVLELLTAGECALLEEVRARGELLKTRLQDLQRRYPQIIKSIRGRGLMLGIEFGLSRDTFPGSLLGIMAEQELLTPAISAYLLNRERIRVAPTLNGSAVIRIEPPLIISEAQCLEAIEGIENVLSVLSTGSTARLLGHLVGHGEERSCPPYVPKPGNAVSASGEPGEGRFAFLVHPLDLDSYCQFDSSLQSFSREELADLARRLNDNLAPFVISRAAVTSAAGGKAFGEFIVVPRTAEEFLRMPRSQALAELKAAVALAREEGARIVGLGAYTAVVSGGGLYLKEEGVPITSGNSYTVVSAVEGINAAAARLGLPRSEITAAVVGAAGSIGKGVALLLSETVPHLILIGNPGNKDSSRRLQLVAAEIYRYQASLLSRGRPLEPGSMGERLAGCPDLPPAGAPREAFLEFAQGRGRQMGLFELSTHIDAVLARAELVITATSSPEKIIRPGSLKRGAVVCDISRPSNVSEEVKRSRPDVLVIDGGIVEVPGRPYLGWDFGLEPGLAYACMAETMILALEQHYRHYSLGSSGVNLESILWIRRLAAKHGFRCLARQLCQLQRKF